MRGYNIPIAKFTLVVCLVVVPVDLILQACHLL